MGNTNEIKKPFPNQNQTPDNGARISYALAGQRFSRRGARAIRFVLRQEYDF